MKILQIKLIGFKRFQLNQIDSFDMVINNPMQVILGSNSSGKAQPLDALIKVPNGWLKMGQMEIDTEVIAKDGSITKVTGVFPQGIKEIFKITFSDGRSTECCSDHLWRVYTGGREHPIVPKIMNMVELNRRLSLKSINNLLWVDLIDSEQNNDIELPIDPYLLGVFLGDGCGRKNTPEIITPDLFIINEISKALPTECMISGGYSRKINTVGEADCYTYCIKKKLGEKTNTFTKKLIELNLYNKLGHDKFIPEEYLHASSKQRLHMLQGLLDTDGTVDAHNSTVSFSSSSEKLARGVQYLVRSLGGIAKLVTRVPHYTYLGERLEGRIDFRVHIRYKKQSELFRLPKKKERTNDNNQYANTLKLRIKTIESIGFKEAQCISIEHYDHLYVTDQFIVTHNTSLLQQLSPLPAHPNDFVKTGSKHITISHHGCIYNLVSVFSPSQKHSFIKDDVELNDGGTVTIQRELVKTYFKITPDIHSLQLGDETFDTMSPSRRKEWFILLCDTSYDYAINVFNKLKERHRDVTGALKLAKKKLLIESEKLIKTDEEIKLKEEVQIIHDQLNSLLEFRKPVESDLTVLNFKQRELDIQLLKTSNVLLNLINKRKQNIPDEKCLEYINKLNAKMITAQTLISKYSNEYNANSNKINILKKAEEDTNESLMLKLNNINTNKNDLEKDLLFVDNFDPVSVMNSFLTVKNTLSDIFSTIPNNSDKKYSSELLNIAKNNLTELTIKKKNFLDKLESLLSKQKHMTAHKNNPDINCPNCNYLFSLHYNDKSFKLISDEITNLENSLDQLNIELKKHESYIEDCAQYSVLYRQYMQCVNNFSNLKPYWDYLSNKNTITNNPQYGVIELGNIESDIKKQIIYSRILKEENEINSLIKSLKDIGGSDLNTLVLINEELNNNIEKYTNELQKAKQTKLQYTDLLSLNKEITIMNSKVKTIMDNKYSICLNEIETTRRHIFNSTIKILQTQLSDKVHILTGIKSQKSMVENTIISINELESEEAALSVLVKQLSPSDGLIAEGLFGFIRGFINQMNSIIKKVWTFPLEIKPCELTDNNSVDLDYKFPVQLSNSIVSDVNKGSTGMIEIINLAFKIVALKFLGLQNAPLILDELGRTLDTAHKTGIINLTKQLVEQHIFTQVFMVSHDFSQYSAMLNVDTCVLSPDNIILPVNYNKHVKMSSLN